MVADGADQALSAIGEFLAPEGQTQGCRGQLVQLQIRLMEVDVVSRTIGKGAGLLAELT